MAALLMRAVGAASRIFGPRQKQFGGSFMTPVGGSGIPPSWPANWWQLGYDPLRHSSSAVVYACRSAYSQTLAMCPGTHWQSDGKGGRTRVTTSALSRFMRRPNAYQSASDWMLYLVDCLYGDGQAFGLAIRNNRYEITEIHLMDPHRCAVSVGETGELFYSLGGNEIVERMFDRGALQRVPARDVLHVRLPDPRNPLKGCAPLEAALLEVAVSNAMVGQALAYASNQGRPSGVIQTDIALETEEQLDRLRASWNRQTQGVNAGGTAILTNGLKWIPSVVNSRDAQLAEMLQVSDQRIATAYRVPLPLLSLMQGTGPQASTEALMGFWVSTGLGFAANHIEDPIGRLFGLGGVPDDYLELDLQTLLRANFKDRIEGLARGVQGGIYSPNEARALEDLPAMEFGEEVRLQQQVVPLSAWAQIGTPAEPSAPMPDAPPASPAAAGADVKADRLALALVELDRAGHSYAHP